MSKESIKSFLISKTNFITFLITAALSYTFYVFQPNEMVPFKIFILFVFLVFILLWALIISLFRNKDLNAHFDESIKNPHFSVANSEIIQLSTDIFLCTPSPFLEQDSFASLYIKDDKFEHLIGYALIINKQVDNLLQIKAFELPDTVYSAELNPLPFNEYLMQNRKNIFIKPTITKQSVELLKKL